MKGYVHSSLLDFFKAFAQYALITFDTFFDSGCRQLKLLNYSDIWPINCL